MRKKLIKDVSAKNGNTIPKDTMVDISFPKEHSGQLFRMTDPITGQTVSSYTCKIDKYVGIKVPSIESLYKKAASASTAQSVGGKTVEPDGWDSDGTPSWLLAIGVI